MGLSRKEVIAGALSLLCFFLLFLSPSLVLAFSLSFSFDELPFDLLLCLLEVGFGDVAKLGF